MTSTFELTFSLFHYANVFTYVLLSFLNYPKGIFDRQERNRKNGVINHLGEKNKKGIRKERSFFL